MPAGLRRCLRLAPPTRPDRDLLRAHLDGADPAAFAELVRRHAGLARRAAAEVCPTAADDVAQATLALLARKAAAVAGRESAAGWVFETARRLALKARTAAARRAARESRAAPPRPPADPLDTLTLREIRAVVAEELARLPDELRLPLVLCYWDDADRATAADRLGCSVSTLKRRLDAGRERLAARLSRRGLAGSAVLAALVAVEAAASAAVPAVAPAVRASVPWKALSAVVLAAGVAVGIGSAVSAPGAPETVAEPPAPATNPAPPPAAEPAPTTDRHGDPLPEGAVARLGTVRFRHGVGLHTVAYSPDGKILASGGYGRIVLWEAATGKPLGALTLHPVNGASPLTFGHTFGLAFTPDGTQLISVGSPSSGRDSGQLTHWHVESRGFIHSSTTKTGAAGTHWVRAVAVSEEARIVAHGTDAGDLRLTSLGFDKPITVKLDRVSGLSFSPDGHTLAVATYTDVVLLSTATGREVKRLKPGAGRLVAFAPDGKSVWVGCDGGQRFNKGDNAPGKLVRWDLEAGRVAQTFKTVPELFLSLAVSPDGKTLASGGVNAGPFLWDAATGASVDLDPAGPRVKGWVHGLAFSPDGKTLAVAGSNGRVRVWDVATRKELHAGDEHTGGIVHAAVPPDGKSVATAGGDGTVRLWDLATGKAVRSWSVDEKRGVWAVDYTPDGRHLLTAGWDGVVRLWYVAAAKEVRRFGEVKDGARAALSPDGKLVAASGTDGCSITLYETATGRVVHELTGHVSLLTGLKFSPDGRLLVSGASMHTAGGKHFDDRSVRVWDVATGRQLLKLDSGRPHGDAAVSPDGRVVVASGYLEAEKVTALRFWDARSGKEMVGRRVPGAVAVAFRPDGRLVATADRDVRLVEVASGRVVQTFTSGASSVYSLTFTPDGRRLISAHDDGTALVWDVTVRPAVGAAPGKLWEELASDDATAARRAAAALAADPAAAVALLGEKLKPVPKPAVVRTTAALIADLDAAAFPVREAAEKELARRVGTDYAELSAALAATQSVEVRRRLTGVLRTVPSPWPSLSADDLRAVRAVGVLEAAGTPEARRLLKALADGDPAAVLTREARAACGRLGG